MFKSWGLLVLTGKCPEYTIITGVLLRQDRGEHCNDDNKTDYYEAYEGKFIAK